MQKIALRFPTLIREIRGHGMIWGAEFKKPAITSAICAQAFTDGLIIETAGADSEVIKFLGPLVITPALIDEGFDILENAIEQVVQTGEFK
jgi:diaminobutyrate-2-oxoglutarate transaminase